MAQRVKKHWALLQCLLEAESNSHARAFIRATSKEQVLTICELAANVLYGILPISALYKKKLKPHKKLIETLAGTTRVTRKIRELLQRHIKVIVVLLNSVKAVLKATV